MDDGGDEVDVEDGIDVEDVEEDGDGKEAEAVEARHSCQEERTGVLRSLHGGQYVME